MRVRDIISIYSSGLCELFCSALAFAVFVLCGLQMLARVTDTIFDSSAALLLSWEMILLMALWPGQRYWTITRSTMTRRHHSIIGVPTDADFSVVTAAT